MDSGSNNVRFLDSKLVLSFLALAILILCSSGFGGLLLTHSESSTALALNNVQILVQTSGNNFSAFSLTIYNSTGYVVGSSDSMHPAFGAELPPGSYLFTVAAFQSYGYYSPYGYATGSSSNVPSSAPSQATGSISQEYGYAMQNINGASTISIETTTLYNETTSKVRVHVSYVNGSNAGGVYVQGSIVGAMYYYYGYEKPNLLVMWNQTGPDGTATLVVPDVPVEISAWTYIAVDLPKNLTTVQTNIGGEKINVTIYWQPMYVWLAGTDLIMPSDTTSNIVLHAQQSNYWIMPYAVNSATAPNPGIAYSQAPSQPAAIGIGNKIGAPIQQQQIPARSTSTTVTTTIVTQTTSQNAPVATDYLIATAIIVALALSIAAIFLGSRRK